MLEAQRVEKRDVVPLKDAKEVRHVAAAIVDHLGLRTPGAAQEDASHADEGFGIGGACGGVDRGTDAAGEVPLAAQPGGDGISGADRRHGFSIGK